MNLNLNVVFVCFNCAEDILSVISDMEVGDYPLNKVTVYVVDNASTDDSVKLLKSHSGFPLKLIELNENVGFGTGCNRAFDCIEGDGLTLLLNPDIRLHKNSILNLVNYSRNRPESGIWGGRTTDFEGVDDGYCAWREPSLLGVVCWSFFIDYIIKKFGLRNPDSYSYKKLSEDIDVDIVSGCFFLIENDLLKRLEGFDEQFFMYSEEVDLCRRARLLGAKPSSTVNATIVHELSKTLTSENKINFQFESKFKYYQKYWSGLAILIARMSVLVGSLVRCFAFYTLGIFENNKREKARIWLKFSIRQLMGRL